MFGVTVMIGWVNKTRGTSSMRWSRVKRRSFGNIQLNHVEQLFRGVKCVGRFVKIIWNMIHGILIYVEYFRFFELIRDLISTFCPFGQFHGWFVLWTHFRFFCTVLDLIILFFKYKESWVKFLTQPTCS